MSRVKRGIQVKKTHKKWFKLAKGYKHGRKNLIRRVHEAVMRAGQHAYTHRKTKKRNFRQLWIVRINAACRANNTKYSEFIKALNDNKIVLDRKVLADLAMNHPEEFKKVLDKVKK